MPYGHLTAEHASTLLPFVKGRVVHDLGAGDCSLAQQLLAKCEAKTVVAVDHHLEHGKRGDVTCVGESFQQYALRRPSIDVAFVSWPANRPHTSIETLIRYADTVVYLGSNVDCSACGTQQMFEHLQHRRVLAHSPHLRNTLLVYGKGRVTRPLVGEEIAGLCNWYGGQIFSYVDTLRFGSSSATPMQSETETTYIATPGGDGNLITSARVSRVGAHDRVRIWARGGLAGELTLNAGDGPLLMRLLNLAVEHEGQ